MSATNHFANVTENVRTGADSPKHAALGDALKSDTLELPNVTQGFMITVDGALKVVTYGGETITFPSGTFNVKQPYALRIRQIWSTGTGATGIILFY